MLRKGRKLCSANLPQPRKDCASALAGPFVLFQPAANSPLVSLWSTSLGSTCLRHPTCLRQVDGGAALPRSKLRFGGKALPRASVFCAAVLRSRPWGLCPQTSATFVKVDETFDSRSFAFSSLWLFCPRFGCYLTRVSVPLLMRSSPSYCPANAGSVLWHT